MKAILAWKLVTGIKADHLMWHVEHADQIWMAGLGETDIQCHLLSQESGENPKTNDCYFCMVDISKFSKKLKNRHDIAYPSIPSSIAPVPHNNELPDASAQTTMQ